MGLKNRSYIFFAWRQKNNNNKSSSHWGLEYTAFYALGQTQPFLPQKGMSCLWH